MTVSPELARLAAAHGVAIDYKDQLERTVQVAPESVVAVLNALAVDASTPAAIAASLRDVEARPAVPPVVVMRLSEHREIPVTCRALVRESGEEVPHRHLGGMTRIEGSVLGLGWHALHTAGGVVPVVVAPDRLTHPVGRHWGLMVQLYAMRSQSSWGIGDLHDLATLCRWTADAGGDLVLVNPLHATAPTLPMQDSPYYPASRRWTNPIYLNPFELPAFEGAIEDVTSHVAAFCGESWHDDRIDRNAVWRAKRKALHILYDDVRPQIDIDALEPALRDWATWCALAEVHGADWRTWPQPLRRPDAPAVARARHELADAVRFHAWLQQQCDEQLARVQGEAEAAGMDIGVVHDLAVGTDPAGADAWAMQDALALGARIGAPPDLFNQQGQDWGMPPWHPRRLAELGYAPLRDMLRGLLRHAGGVRIDHVLGLFRMWWVPADGTARDGTYVSYDVDALLGVVSLEAERAGAVVIGEDLGTVTPVVRRELAARHVLGTSVLWFEREDPVDGEPGPLRPLEDWREHAAASVTTHDLPTALGWLRGEHVRVRTELGLLDDPAAEQKAWQREREELLELLRSAGLVGADPTEEELGNVTDDRLVEALHHAVAATPSTLVLVAPGDVIGDVRAPNLPGTTDEYPSWRLPLADAHGRPVLLDEVLDDPRLRRLAAHLSRTVR